MVELLYKLDKVRANLEPGRLFQQLNWSIQRGEHWAIIGPNGAGKTALAKILGRELAIASGTISLAEGFKPRRDTRYVSFEAQASLLARDQRMDISELCDNACDVGTTARSIILEGGAEPEDWSEVVEQLGIADFLDKGIRYLSSGELRKVLIANAVVARPQLLVLDNPLEGLDLKSQNDVREWIGRLMAGGQQTLLLTRRQQDILPGITHILALKDLTVLACGPRDELMQGQAILSLFPKPPALGPLPKPDPGWQRLIPDPAVPLIEIRQLQANYQGKKVFDGLDWTMRPGQHTAISGPNGCGKSTLLNLICAENHMAYGQQVTLFGKRRGSGESIWDVKAYFGLVSNQLQNRYIRGWSAEEVVISGFFDSVGLYDNYGGLETQTAKAWLAALGLAQLSGELFQRLSFGQQRMVLVARAMVKQPPILILDEPCTGLDDYNRQLILRTIDDIAALTDTHIIFVSHLEDETPECINQRLVFTARSDRLYDLVEQPSE